MARELARQAAPSPLSPLFSPRSQVGRIEELIQYVDKTNCDRICAYLGQLAQYVPEPEDGIVLTVAVNSLRKLARYPEALMMAVRLQDDALLEEILSSCDDP